jgi:hypothetical protein
VGQNFSYPNIMEMIQPFTEGEMAEELSTLLGMSVD